MSQYDFYLKSVLLPIAPSQLKISINNNNSTYVLIDEGQINILKKAKLTDIEFECLIPQVQYPFAVYTGGFQKANFFLDHFEKLKTEQKPFQFIVSRTMPNGNVLFSTNIKVSMEDYKVTEAAKEGFDLTVKIKLKQYRDHATKTCQIQEKSLETGSEETKVEVIPEEPRAPSSTDNAPDSALPATYTVKAEDCLWNIAKKYYGNGANYTKIQSANSAVIAKHGSNPNMIWPGDVLTIPA